MDVSKKITEKRKTINDNKNGLFLFDKLKNNKNKQ